MQDLEKHLAHARQEVSQLRSLLKSGGSSTTERKPLYPTSLLQAEQKPQRPRLKKDFSNVQQNLKTFGQGVIKVPLPQLSIRSTSYSAPELPSRQIADELLHAYHNSFQRVLPILHWPMFAERYNRVYQDGSLRNEPRAWVVLLFVVLACGALGGGTDGSNYFQVSQDLVQLWENDLSIDHVRFGLLSSVYLTERNLRSAGWVALGHAVRVAQDLGLHRESRSTEDNENRRCLWWSVYATDRYISATPTLEL